MISQPSSTWRLLTTGVNVHSSVKTTGRVMMLTSLAYIIIQGPAFAENCDRNSTCHAQGKQHTWCDRWRLGMGPGAAGSARVVAIGLELWPAVCVSRALIGIFLSIVGFVGYLWFQVGRMCVCVCVCVCVFVCVCESNCVFVCVFACDRRR